MGERDSNPGSHYTREQAMSLRYKATIGSHNIYLCFKKIHLKNKIVLLYNEPVACTKANPS